MRIVIHCLFVSTILLSGVSAVAQEPDPKLVALYKSRCAACHGVDGKAETAAGKKLNTRSFFLPEVLKATDQEWIDITAKGKAKMPGFEKKLTDAQIKALVVYSRELTKKKP